MHDISFQAIQFVPRLLSVSILLFLTWLVAKFTKSVVLRAVREDETNFSSKRFIKLVAQISFWTVFILFSPFIFGATGLDVALPRQFQVFLGQLFSNWPVWMLMSLLVAGISYLLHHVPKFIVALKESPGTSPKKY